MLKERDQGKLMRDDSREACTGRSFDFGFERH